MTPLLTPRPEVIWDEVDGVLTICDTASGEMFSLNPTAALIWSAGTDGDAGEVVDRLAAMHPDQDRAALAADVSAFAATLGPLLAAMAPVQPERAR